MKTLRCAVEQDMKDLGSLLAMTLQGRNILTLRGELGAGKSVLARSIIHAAGFPGHVKSPTYTLVETYLIDEPLASVTSVAHFDLYRLADPDELHYLAFDDLVEQHDLVIIEWPEQAGELLPVPDIEMRIEYAENEGRLVHLESKKPLSI